MRFCIVAHEQPDRQLLLFVSLEPKQQCCRALKQLATRLVIRDWRSVAWTRLGVLASLSCEGSVGVPRAADCSAQRAVALWRHEFAPGLFKRAAAPLGRG